MDYTISEETAISNPGHDHIYMRFSKRKKQVILALLSSFGLMHLTIAQAIRLCVPAVASDLNTQPSLMGHSIGLWLFAACLGGLTGGVYSTFSGRRPVNLVGASLMCFGSISAGLSTSVPVYMVSRAIEGLGAGSVAYVGSAVIGDIYQLEQRGNALGVLRSVTFIGMILTLPIGGLVTAYASWRTLQFCLGVMGGLIFILMFLYFPETSHPGMRGIDQIPPSNRPSKFMIINPLKPLVLLRSPNILAISFTVFTAFLAESVLTVPLAWTLDSKFDIANPAIISVCFVLVAIGNMFGTLLSGRISDIVVVHHKAHRNGIWLPEDRLRTALPATLVGVPFAVLVFGLVAEYLPGSWVGLSLCLSCLFVNGVVTEFVLSPSIAYLTDLLPEQSAEAVAATTSLSLLLLSVSVGWIIPAIELLGITGINTLVAILAWGGHIVLWYTVKHGVKSERMGHIR